MPVYENTQPPYSVAPGESAQAIVTNADGTATLGAGNFSERVAITDPYGGDAKPIIVQSKYASLPAAVQYDIYTAVDDTTPPADWALAGSMSAPAGERVALHRVGVGGQAFRFLCVKEVVSPGVKTTITVRQ